MLGGKPRELLGTLFETISSQAVRETGGRFNAQAMEPKSFGYGGKGPRVRGTLMLGDDMC